MTQDKNVGSSEPGKTCSEEALLVFLSDLDSHNKILARFELTDPNPDC